MRSALDPERTSVRAGLLRRLPGLRARACPSCCRRRRSPTSASATRRRPSARCSPRPARRRRGSPAGFEDWSSRLRREGGVDLERELLAALGGEAALALEPARRPRAGAARPYLALVAAGVDEQRARRALAGAAGSRSPRPSIPAATCRRRCSASARSAGSRRAACGSRRRSSSPTRVFDGLAAIATDPAGVARSIADQGGLADAELFRRATEELRRRRQVSLLGYLDLGGLVAIGEQLGLAEDPRLRHLRGELRRLEALGFAVSAPTSCSAPTPDCWSPASEDDPAAPQPTAPPD